MATRSPNRISRITVKTQNYHISLQPRVIRGTLNHSESFCSRTVLRDINYADRLEIPAQLPFLSCGSLYMLLAILCII